VNAIPPLDSAASEIRPDARRDPHDDSPAMTRFAIAILVLAIVLGAVLRFADLGGLEMSSDEGASWAAAAAPSVGAVLRAQSTLNPGKAGLHDLALHLWMRAFGHGLATMRALSAAVGTLAIILVFATAREIFAATRAPAPGDRSGPAARIDAAAIAALIFAVNLLAIKYSREVRMYSFVIAAVVAQTWCFFRAYRRAGLAAYAGVAIFIAVAVAIHLTAVLAFAGEGLWLLYLIARNRLDRDFPQVRRAFALLGALAAGAVLIVLSTPAMLTGAAHAADAGAINWIPQPALWAPFALFNKATGSFAYPVMAALAVYGVVRGWRRWHDAVVFALLWMWAPPFVLLAVSYAIRPAFVERYLVSCFVPFFILMAIGIVELRSRFARNGALALAVILALGHIVAWARKPHDVQWREAARAAQAALASSASETSAKPISGDATVAVTPRYAVNVVRYYLGDIPRVRSAHALDKHGPDPASVIIIGEQGVAPAMATELRRRYPHRLAVLRGVVVRERY
jgi:4-amino-4-deoxy-L-arabinose transferase-like glycosyltransferase